MVLKRVGAIFKRRWPTFVIAAAVVALAGLGLVTRGQPGAGTATSVTQLSVAGPLRERDQYAVDLNVVANDISRTVAAYLGSDVVLSRVKMQLPLDASTATLRSMLQVSVMPDSSILEIRVSGNDLTSTGLILSAFQREALNLVEMMSAQRFEGESPLEATVLVDSTSIAPAESSDTVFWIALAFLSMVAGVGAAWLRDSVDPMVRDAEDFRRELTPGIPLIHGSWRRSALEMRAEIDVTDSRVVVVVPAGASNPAGAFEALVDAFVAAGQKYRVLDLAASSLRGAVEVAQLDSADFRDAVTSDRTCVVSCGPSARLTKEAVVAGLKSLTEDGSFVLVLAGSPQDSVGLSMLRHSVDLVVVVGAVALDRKDQIKSTLTKVERARAVGAATVLWLGA